MVKKLSRENLYKFRAPQNFHVAMRDDINLLLENRRHLSLTTIILCFMDALAAGSGKAEPKKFQQFVLQHFPALCEDLRNVTNQAGEVVLYKKFRCSFAHLRGLESGFAIAEDNELDGAFAGEIEIDGGGRYVALNVDRLAREFSSLLENLSTAAATTTATTLSRSEDREP